MHESEIGEAKMYKNIRAHRPQKKNYILPLLLMLAFALVISLAIATIWQKLSGDDQKLARASQAEAEMIARKSELEASSSQQESSSEVEHAASSSSEPQESSSPVDETGAVAENPNRVKNDYFEDAVFVGDSITTGIELYGIMENTTVLASTGLNLGTAYTSPVVEQEDGTKIPVMEALKQKEYAKVYIMLGGNEVRDEDEATFISRYTQLLEDMKAQQPNAIIYVQSILPVTKNNNYQMDNTRIDQFNQALKELCQEQEVYYLDVASCMKNEEGALPDEASPADGMHFGPEYYQKWFTYLRSHTVDAAQ